MRVTVGNKLCFGSEPVEIWGNSHSVVLNHSDIPVDGMVLGLGIYLRSENNILNFARVIK